MDIQYYTQHQICHTIKALSCTSGARSASYPTWNMHASHADAAWGEGAARGSQLIRTATGLSIPDRRAAASLHKNVCPLLLVISVLALQETKTQITPQQSCIRGPTPKGKTDSRPPANTQDERWREHKRQATKQPLPASTRQADKRPSRSHSPGCSYWFRSEGGRGSFTQSHSSSLCWAWSGCLKSRPHPEPAVNRSVTGSPSHKRHWHHFRHTQGNIPHCSLQGQKGFLLNYPALGLFTRVENSSSKYDWFTISL